MGKLKANKIIHKCFNIKYNCKNKSKVNSKIKTSFYQKNCLKKGKNSSFIIEVHHKEILMVISFLVKLSQEIQIIKALIGFLIWDIRF